MMKVLIADDEELIIKGYKRLFDWASYHYDIVAEAMDGAEAIEKARIFRPDIILIDINMPKMNGLQAIKEIKSILPSVGIIIISGYDDFALVREALLLQVADYLLKPVNFEELALCLVKISDQQLADDKAHFDLNALQEMPGHETGGLKTIEKMLAFIDESISDPELSLKKLSNEFHMNPYYISSYFKNKTETNFLDYISQRRIQLAKNMLDQTDLTISAISERVGISDYRNFSKLFKKYVGMQPSQYRSK